MIALALLACPLAVLAAPGSSPQQLRATSASADLDRGLLVIHGESLGMKPSVQMGRVGGGLESLSVLSASASRVEVALATTEPGSYVVIVSDGPAANRSWMLDVTLGSMGPQGEAGPAGAQGPQGLQGEAGPAGAQGPQGEAGPAGARGPQGEAGPAGARGPQGEAGPAGPQGPEGPHGPAGMLGLEAIASRLAVAGMNPGQVRSKETACPAGKVVVGGGWDVSQGAALTKNLTIIQDTPAARDVNGRPTSWRVSVRNDGSPMLGPDIVLSFDLEVTALGVALP
jgi:hypothetical protein